ncbi:MAG: futalosine hydrolase [Desulfurivibrio sp.]|nr:futalosine hydrolase [Desulfurivibrio sp.]
MQHDGQNGERLLLVSATAMELAPLRRALTVAGVAEAVDLLVCGVGPTAAAATLAAYLAQATSPGGNAGGKPYSGVVLSGIGGLYPSHAASPPVVGGDYDHPPDLLSLCLAEREILGDFGLAAPHGAEPFGHPELDVEREFELASPLLSRAAEILRALGIPYYGGSFVTVNAASTTSRRGRALADHYQALCENMEGGAVALVCRRWQLPLLELRCISNLVEDRDLGRWQLAAALQRQAAVVGELLPRLLAPPPATTAPGRETASHASQTLSRVNAANGGKRDADERR